MFILYLWVLVVFTGFVMQVFLTGMAFKDRQWFRRLGFSEDAQDIAEGDVETEIKDCLVHFIFLFIGVVSFVRGSSQEEMTVTQLIFGLLFITAPVVLIVFSFRRQRRRAKVEKRSRDDAMEVLARKVEHVEERR